MEPRTGPISSSLGDADVLDGPAGGRNATAGMAQPLLVTVGVWQRKTSEVAHENHDDLFTAAEKGFEAMAAVLANYSDPAPVQRALARLNCERTLALQLDKAKDEPVRGLVHGLLESLHGTITEWAEERNQKKDTGEICTQTDKSSAHDSLKIAELGRKIVELEEEVGKWKHLSEGACREAGCALMRAEYAEKQLEDKRNVKESADTAIAKADELEKREGTLQQEITQLTKEVAELRSNKNLLTIEIDDLRKKLQKIEIVEDTTQSIPPPRNSSRLNVTPSYNHFLDHTYTKEKMKEPIKSQEVTKDIQILARYAAGEEVPIEDEDMQHDNADNFGTTKGEKRQRLVVHSDEDDEPSKKRDIKVLVKAETRSNMDSNGSKAAVLAKRIQEFKTIYGDTDYVLHLETDSADEVFTASTMTMAEAEKLRKIVGLRNLRVAGFDLIAKKQELIDILMAAPNRTINGVRLDMI